MLHSGGHQLQAPSFGNYKQTQPTGFHDAQQQRPPQQGLQPQPQQQPHEHQDVIHDTQFDYYGQRLATASSDRTIGIHAIRSGEIQRIATLVGHDGPVWMVSWAHPRFGTALASASYDHKAIVWKELSQPSHQWRPVHVIDIHQGSVNAVQWAPDAPMLATASSDGTVAVTAYEEGAWRESVKLSNNSNNIAHAMGATCVSFAPLCPQLSNGRLLVSGGCDSRVRLWYLPDGGAARAQPYHFLELLEGHTDWVRDTAFEPLSAATRYAVIASCGQDRSVIIHRKRWDYIAASIEDRMLRNGEGGKDAIGEVNGGWERSVVLFDEPVWRLSWSPTGGMLVVTTGNSEVFALREGNDFCQPWLKTPLNEYENSTQRAY